MVYRRPHLVPPAGLTGYFFPLIYIYSDVMHCHLSRFYLCVSDYGEPYQLKYFILTILTVHQLLHICSYNTSESTS
jgi:hypothetical protein